MVTSGTTTISAVTEEGARTAYIRLCAAAFLVLVYAVGVAVSTAATGAFITDLTRRARYGAAHGVFGTIHDVGDALGPIAAGLLVASFGYARMFQTVASVAAMATIAFAMLSANRRT